MLQRKFQPRMSAQPLDILALLIAEFLQLLKIRRALGRQRTRMLFNTELREDHYRKSKLFLKLGLACRKQQVTISQQSC